MVPALVVLYLPLYLIGSALQSALGLEEDQMLTEAGAWGVAAAALMVVLTLCPQIAGIVLGLEARRRGERTLGTAGVLANAVIGAFFLVGSLVQLLAA
jgi:hypothetical protein